jgi:hypothetical protein
MMVLIVHALQQYVISGPNYIVIENFEGTILTVENHHTASPTMFRPIAGLANPPSRSFHTCVVLVFHRKAKLVPHRKVI